MRALSFPHQALLVTRLALQSKLFEVILVFKTLFLCINPGARQLLHDKYKQIILFRKKHFQPGVIERTYLEHTCKDYYDLFRAQDAKRKVPYVKPFPGFHSN